jgi:hypothetical protein
VFDRFNPSYSTQIIHNGMHFSPRLKRVFLQQAWIDHGETHALPEMGFLDINLTEDLSLLLHAIHSLSTGGF